MTTPALLWVDSIQVGNATAKALLRFLATHNFHKPGFFFKNSTYMAALEVSKKTLQRAFNHLENGKFITIEKRFDANGRQLTNVIYLSIPEQFLADYEKKIQDSYSTSAKDIPRQDDAPRGVKMTRGGRQDDAPYNNNINNNINIKRERTKRAPLPDGFKPDEKRNIFLDHTVIKTGLSSNELLTKFKNIAKLREKRSLDWQLELENFLINEKPYTTKQSNQFINKTEPRSAVNNMPEYESKKEERKPISDLGRITLLGIMKNLGCESRIKFSNN